MDGLKKILHDLAQIIDGLFKLQLIDKETRDAIKKIISGLVDIVDGVAASRRSWKR